MNNEPINQAVARLHDAGHGKLADAVRELEADLDTLRRLNEQLLSGNCKLVEERDDLRAALAKREAVAVPEVKAHAMLLAIADEAFKSWDEGRDARVGKILRALAYPHIGEGYRKDIDELHAMLAASQQAAKGEGT